MLITLRRYWRHLACAHALVLLAIVLALVFGVFSSSPQIRTIFGQHLDKRAFHAYAQAWQHRTEQSQRFEHETLPPATAAKLTAENARLAKLVNVHPYPLATPQPKLITGLVGNHSSRNGAKVLLWVVHDAEMPNVPGFRSLYAIRAWFNNKVAQASSNYATDAWGNSILMVPTTLKAWHVAWFNGWSIGDELIGYASQKTWPAAQLRSAAQLAAHDAAKYGFPIQRGLVKGCSIVRPGIVEHADLGACGGGHHDPGINFPIAHFIQLVRQYAHGAPHLPTIAERRATARRAVLRDRAHGESWPQVKATAEYRLFIALGGH